MENNMKQDDSWLNHDFDWDINEEIRDCQEWRRLFREKNKMTEGDEQAGLEEFVNGLDDLELKEYLKELHGFK